MESPQATAPDSVADPAPAPSRSSPAPPPLWRRALANLGLYAWVVPGTVILGLLAVLVSWIPPRGRGMLLCARVWSRCLLAASGVRLEVEAVPAWPPEPGAEEKPGEGSVAGGRPVRAGSYVFMANHESYFDVPALLATLPGQVRFAAKRTLFHIPVFGWSLWAGGFIPVDRRNRARAKDAFEIAARRIRAGASVLFFPEGTRSPDGRLHAFERGGFLLALKSGAPIVPVGISGSFRILPRNRLRVHPGKIRIRLGTPIDTSAYGVRNRRELEARVRAEILALSGAEDAQADRAGPGAGGC